MLLLDSGFMLEDEYGVQFRRKIQEPLLPIPNPQQRLQDRPPPLILSLLSYDQSDHVTALTSTR